MLADNLIEPDELDPRRLFERSKRVERPECIEERTIHVTLISENTSLHRKGIWYKQKRCGICMLARS